MHYSIIVVLYILYKIRHSPSSEISEKGESATDFSERRLSRRATSSQKGTPRVSALLLVADKAINAGAGPSRL